MRRRFPALMMLAASVMLLLLSAPQLTAAARKSQQGRNRLRGVQYISAEKTPDAALEKAILQTIPDYNPESPEREVRYFYNRVDLNADGKPEVIVFLLGSYICGTGGCDTLIFQTEGDGYRLVSDIPLSRSPILVSPNRTHGWNDLIMYVVGGGITRGYYVKLQFDGRTYPDNPTVLPKMKPGATLSGKAYIADEDLSPGTGIALKRAQR